jgi:hypothetical protein
MGTLTVANWEKYQHYHKNLPPCIRMYVNIIDEFNVDGTPKTFRMLPDKAKLTFLMLMCLASKFGCIIHQIVKHGSNDKQA